MPLNITYQDSKTVVDDGSTALIGADAAATIRIVRPGISRKHAIVSFDGTVWKIEDAGSRNGVFLDGRRIQTKVIEESTVLYLGHATDGEAITFTPTVAGSDANQEEIEAFVAAEPPTKEPAVTPDKQVPTRPVERTQVQPVPVNARANAELAELASAIRDQISAVKGLTWSVWAMIAVTAVLAIMTLFVGILGS